MRHFVYYSLKKVSVLCSYGKKLSFSATFSHSLSSLLFVQDKLIACVLWDENHRRKQSFFLPTFWHPFHAPKDHTSLIRKKHPSRSWGNFDWNFRRAVVHALVWFIFRLRTLGNKLVQGRLYWLFGQWLDWFILIFDLFYHTFAAKIQSKYSLNSVKTQQKCSQNSAKMQPKFSQNAAKIQSNAA